MTDKKDIVGFFCWQNINGKHYRTKYDILGESVHRDTKEYFASMEVVKIPLTKELYALSLDELAAKFPLPEKAKND